MAVAITLTGCGTGEATKAVNDTQNVQQDSSLQKDASSQMKDETKDFSKNYTVFKVSLDDDNYELSYVEDVKTYSIIRKEDNISVGYIEHAYPRQDDERLPADYKNSDSSKSFFSDYILAKYDVADCTYVDGDTWYVIVDGSDDVAYGQTEGLTDEEIQQLINYVLHPFWGQDNLKYMMTGTFCYDGPDKVIDKEEAINLISKIKVEVEIVSLDSLDVNPADVYVNQP